MRTRLRHLWRAAAAAFTLAAVGVWVGCLSAYGAATRPAGGAGEATGPAPKPVETQAAPADTPEGYRQIQLAAQALAGLLTDRELPLEQWVARVSKEPWEIRRQVINALGDHRGDDALKRQAYLHFLRDAAEPNMRTACASALRPVDEETTAALLAASGDESPEVRVFACQSLGFAVAGAEVDAASIGKTLLSRMDDKDAWVQRTAVSGLGRLKYHDATGRIVRFYKEHPDDVDVATVCAEALSGLGEKEVVLEAADKALASPNWNQRYFALVALKGVPSPAVVPLLIRHLPGEMKMATREMKEHRLYPRAFLAMVEQLASRTSKRFDLQADRWIDWLESGPRGYPVVKPGQIAKAGPEAQVEFDRTWDARWPRHTPNWDESVKVILEQKATEEIDLRQFIDALSVISKHARLAPPARARQYQHCLRALEDLLEHKEHWKIRSEPTGLRSPSQMLERAIRDASNALSPIPEEPNPAQPQNQPGQV